MVNGLQLSALILLSVVISGFLICILYLCRSKKVDAFLVLTWAIGLLTAITELIFEIYWYDRGFFTSIGGNVTIFLLMSGEGILYWLVAFEFYMSALTMEEILFKKP